MLALWHSRPSLRHNIFAAKCLRQQARVPTTLFPVALSFQLALSLSSGFIA